MKGYQHKNSPGFASIYILSINHYKLVAQIHSYQQCRMLSGNTIRAKELAFQIQNALLESQIRNGAEPFHSDPSGRQPDGGIGICSLTCRRMRYLIPKARSPMGHLPSVSE